MGRLSLGVIMVIILTIRCQHDKSGVGKKVEKKKEDVNINNKQRTTINNFPDFALLVVQRYSSHHQLWNTSFKCQ